MHVIITGAKQIELSIILPCYNPSPAWLQRLLTNLDQIKKEIPYTELVLVNDGSSTNFNVVEVAAAIKNYNDISIVTYATNMGKGYALRQGVQKAKGRYIIYTDIDFPYTHASFMALYENLKSTQNPIAIGVRNPAYYTHLPKARVRISKTLKWVIKNTLRIPTPDTQCGLKGFNAIGKEEFLQTTINRYLFDLEFIFIAARKKLTINKVEVELRPEVVLSKMNLGILLQEFGNFFKILLRSLF